MARSDYEVVLISLYGIKVELTCPMMGSPPLHYRWEKDGHLIAIHDGYEVLGNGSLIISNVSGQDEGRYICIVSNNVREGEYHILLSYENTTGKGLW